MVNSRQKCELNSMCKVTHFVSPYHVGGNWTILPTPGSPMMPWRWPTSFSEGVTFCDEKQNKTYLHFSFLFWYSYQFSRDSYWAIPFQRKPGALKSFFQLYLLLFTVLKSCPSFCHNIILDLHKGVLDENIKTAISSYIPNSGFSLGLKGTGY